MRARANRGRSTTAQLLWRGKAGRGSGRPPLPCMSLPRRRRQNAGTTARTPPDSSVAYCTVSTPSPAQGTELLWAGRKPLRTERRLLEGCEEGHCGKLAAGRWTQSSESHHQRSEAALICGKNMNSGDQEGLTRPGECRSTPEAVEEL
ncbi:unnamed protein product [Boreogadus saida]